MVPYLVFRGHSNVEFVLSETSGLARSCLEIGKSVSAWRLGSLLRR